MWFGNTGNSSDLKPASCPEGEDALGCWGPGAQRRPGPRVEERSVWFWKEEG